MPFPLERSSHPPRYFPCDKLLQTIPPVIHIISVFQVCVTIWKRPLIWTLTDLIKFVTWMYSFVLAAFTKVIVITYFAAVSFSDNWIFVTTITYSLVLHLSATVNLKFMPGVFSILLTFFTKVEIRTYFAPVTVSSEVHYFATIALDV